MNFVRNEMDQHDRKINYIINMSNYLQKYKNFLLPGMMILAASTPMYGSELFFHENFESYKPGLLEPGAGGGINDAWHTFRTDIQNSERFIPEVRLMDRAGLDGSRGLRLSIGLRKLTTRSFFLGVRHIFTADLGGIDLSG